MPNEQRGGQWKRVALLLNLERFYSREVSRGVYNYIHPNIPWVLRLFPHSAHDLSEQLAEWNPTGIIGHITSRQLAERIHERGVPWVHCSDHSWFGEPTVTIDNRLAGSMAAKFFLGKSLASFGYYGFTISFSLDRQAGFLEQLRKADRALDTYIEPAPSVAGYPDPKERIRREQEIVLWLRGLPKPSGVLVQTDDEALRILEFCREVGIRVPNDILVMGIDNNDALCEMAQPPLTTIASPVRRIGYEAASMLDQMFRGRPVCRNLRLPPIGVVERESTGAVLPLDPVLRKALQFIFDHGSRPIMVNDIAAHVGVSRRVLERRFIKVFSRTPRQEIEHFRLRDACNLLAESTLSIAEISDKCGFAEQSHFCAAFRRCYGTTPREWRRNGSPREIERRVRLKLPDSRYQNHTHSKIQEIQGNPNL